MERDESRERGEQQNEGPGIRPRARFIRIVLPLLFFISGVSGLILETVWTRLMVRVFGSTTFAVSTVLTAFMAGLAGGSYLAGRYASRMRRPHQAIVAYGALEVAIGLYALAIPWIADLLPVLHAKLWSLEATSYQLFGLLRFLLVLVVLAFPALAMGATLPLLTRALGEDASQSRGRLIGGLYAINTSGAVLGVFLAGFVLLPRIGIFATNLVACVGDIALGLVALLLGLRVASQPLAETPTEAAKGTQTPAIPSGTVASDRLAKIALGSIALSGAIAMAYEVAWTRALSLVLGSSTYAFSLILLCFLVGLAVGAAVYSRRQTTHPDQAQNLAIAHLLAAATALLGILLMDDLPALLLAGMQFVGLTANATFFLKFVLAALVMVLPTFFMGMLFPAVIQIWSTRAGQTALGGRQNAEHAARSAGEVYAVNTVGSIVGSFAAGFLLIPAVGVEFTLRGLVTAGIALAALFSWVSAARRRRLLFAVCLCFLPIPSLLGSWDMQAMNAGVFRVSRYGDYLGRSKNQPRATPSAKGEQADDDPVLQRARSLVPLASVVDTGLEPPLGYRLREVREGITTTVAIGRTVTSAVSASGCWVRDVLLVNGKPDASLSVLHRQARAGCEALLNAPLGKTPGLRVSASGDAETQVLSGLLPVCLHPKRPKKALVIGWGSGVTVGAILKSRIDRVVAVELERQVLEAARVFRPHNGTPGQDPRLEVVEADGRNYLASSKERFDIIISEPSNPWMAGCSSLFTREFFRRVRTKLKPNGIFLQWLQAYEIAPANVWAVLATLGSVFDSVHVFSPHAAPTDLLLVARPRAKPFVWRKLLACTRGEPGRLLARVGLDRPVDLLARLRAGPFGVRELAKGARLNTDDNSLLEFAAPRDLINYQTYRPRQILESLEKTLENPISHVSGPPSNTDNALCEAHLAAGKFRRARRFVKQHPKSSCSRLLAIVDVPASKLRWPFSSKEPVDKSAALTRAIALRKSKVVGSRATLGRHYLELGFSEGRAARPYKALVFGYAALALSRGNERRLAHRLLAALLTDIWKHRQALDHARLASKEKLSTAHPL
jgi:spermidine synthase